MKILQAIATNDHCNDIFKEEKYGMRIQAAPWVLPSTIKTICFSIAFRTRRMWFQLCTSLYELMLPLGDEAKKPKLTLG